MTLLLICLLARAACRQEDQGRFAQSVEDFYPNGKPQDDRTNVIEANEGKEKEEEEVEEEEKLEEEEGKIEEEEKEDFRAGHLGV